MLESSNKRLPCRGIPELKHAGVYRQYVCVYTYMDTIFFVGKQNNQYANMSKVWRVCALQKKELPACQSHLGIQS